MIWATLIFLGIPLWFCAMGILLLIRNNSSLRKRPGNVPVRVKPPGKSRWVPGHAVWIHDVLAFRASPAAWKEFLVWVAGAVAREPTAEEAKNLHRLGDHKVIATLRIVDGGKIEIAARAEDRVALLGPYADRDAGPSAESAGAHPGVYQAASARRSKCARARLAQPPLDTSTAGVAQPLAEPAARA